MTFVVGLQDFKNHMDEFDAKHWLKKPASRPKKPSKPKMKPAPRTGSGKAPKRR